MTDDILNELVTYHRNYLTAVEDLHHIYQLDAEVVHPRHVDEVGDYAGSMEFYRSCLGAVLEHAVPIVNEWAPAEALLRRGVEAGLITYELGRAGEDAVDLTRGAPCVRDPRPVLRELVTSGRLVKPAVGQCARCKVVRPIDQLDAFTSATSRETVYICHGPQPLPQDRLGLVEAIWWEDSWGEPCSLESSWT